MEFKKFADAVNAQFNKMTKVGKLLQVNVTKEELFEKYLESFPAGTNDIYLVNPVHECNTCKSFIRNIGRAIVINDNDEIETVWDIEPTNTFYDEVAKAMSDFVKSKEINTVFYKSEKKFGAVYNIRLFDDGTTTTFHHFHCEIPNQYLRTQPTEDISNELSTFNVFKRGMLEISIDSVDIVIALIDENNIYRGQEHLSALKKFRELRYNFTKAENKDIFLWKHYHKPGARLKNSVIGTLLVDISNGVDLESAVKSFESKVAPANYKRPKSIVTKAMIENAVKEIDKLGIRDSLPRRHAIPEDISVNDVLFVNRNVKLKDKDPLMEILDVSDNAKITKKSIENAPEISIDKFINEVVPKSKNIKLVVDDKLRNAHQVMVSAPVNADAPNILKWNNNFAWSYKGDFTDSVITQNVKNAGGRIDGILRFSLQWNDEGLDKSTDLDAHCYESRGEHIFYGHKRSRITKGELDIDIQRPGTNIAVENIVWQELKKGSYRMSVHDYTGHGLNGKFTCEIVFNGITYTYEYDGDMKRNNSTVTVATVYYENGRFSIDHDLKPINETANLELVDVKLMSLSPNYWSDNAVGNKHYFFFTDDVKVTEPFRGFYNEFLSDDLMKHRKVFELLAAKMIVNPSENGLKGYGISSTKKGESFAVKVDDKLYKVVL